MFPNALTGVKRIYTAEILSIFAAILGLAANVMFSMNEELVVAAAICILVAAILMIIAFFVNITGVNIASKDEPVFRNALLMLILGIGASILVAASGDNSLLTSLGNTLSRITEFMASYYICTGIINLADRLEDEAVSTKAKRVRMLIMGIWMASALLSLVGTFFSKNEGVLNIAAIIAIVAGLVAIVAYFVYLGLLSKAKKMLAR